MHRRRQASAPSRENIVARADEASQVVREHVGTTPSRVSFGSTGTVFAHFLAPILASFMKTYPKIHLDLVEREDAFLEEAVTSGEIDCAVVTAWGSPRVASSHVLTEEILLVVPRTHRVARALQRRADRTRGRPLLVPRRFR